MAPEPTGTLTPTAEGRDLAIRRAIADRPEAVWATLTDPARTAVWFGPWTGTPGAGHTVQVGFTHEEGDATADVEILACEPARRLEVRTHLGAEGWHLEVSLAPSDGGTVLELVHHLTGDVDVRDIGPGWEYYLDNLLAAHHDRPLVSFDDYYPAQRDYYAALA